MKTIACDVCDAPMTNEVGTHHYTGSGLQNVWLDGVEIRRCTKCDNFEVAIVAMAKLHRAIARLLLRKAGRLAPSEIRFLRKSIGWSSTDFAQHMGVRLECVSRWESETSGKPMGPVADRLLRAFVHIKEPVEDYGLEDIARIDDGDGDERTAASEIRIRLKAARTWVAA